MRWTQADWLNAIEGMLPRSLLGRSILIIVTPIVLLQVVSAWVFYDSHWETVTRRLAQSVAGEIAGIARLMPRPFDPAADSDIFVMANEDLGLDLAFRPGEILPNDPTIMRQNLVDRQLAKALAERVRRPFLIDSRSLEKLIEIHVQLADGVLHVVVPRRRLFSSTTYVFLLWMAGTSLALLAVATLFMRNQVKPIKRLAQAADDFGKGRDVGDFPPVGATEVARAGHAFNQMRQRIRRQIAQRTEMLAGVSHDLRTPLTRMKLQLAMMGEGPEIADLKKDVADMERMIGAYLAFARDESTEQPRPTDLIEIVADVVGGARRQGADIKLAGAGSGLVVPLRPDAFHRALNNVIGNALRYARRIAISFNVSARQAEIIVDDDGPGIKPDLREDVFKPFFRIEGSRNPETGGMGLGLTIARDIMRGHGGDLILATSPLGGLRAVLRLPI
jgi:two-component system, OmpR family, osmolarity sensor histidine kinase EnvZ